MRRYRRCGAPQEGHMTNEAVRGGANEPAEAPKRFPGSSDEASARQKRELHHLRGVRVASPRSSSASGTPAPSQAAFSGLFTLGKHRLHRVRLSLS